MRGAMQMQRNRTRRERPLVLHLTTTDISLELLLGPQLSAFIEAGYDVHATSAPGPFVDAIAARGVTFHPLEHSTRSMSLLADVRAAREFHRLVRRLDPDIVHTHNPKPGVYGRIAARLARVPLVVNTVHGLYAQPTDPLLRRTVFYGLERVAAFFSHAELVQNVEDITVLRSLNVPASKLTVLGNGVDLARFQPSRSEDRRKVRNELGFGDDDLVIGAVGRLVEEKGYRELFDAYRRVRQAIPTARLMVVGPHQPDKSDGLDHAAIEQATRDGVTFLGHRDDVERLYPAMDIYVLASHREGFPRSAMEAAATGLPLVLTNIRGCRQVVDEGVTGLLVAVRDSDALARALIELGNDAERRARMGEGGLAKAKADFDQAKVIETTLHTYDRQARAAARGAQVSWRG